MINLDAPLASKKIPKVLLINVICNKGFVISTRKYVGQMVKNVGSHSLIGFWNKPN